jgi:hypothetical protein
MVKIHTVRPTHIPISFAATVFLAATTYILHKSALSGYWRYDDGVHLVFAVSYAPWQYFFMPEITRLQSANQFFTPWNAFFYDINLWVFGLNPKGFYAHQLIMLWLSSVATFFFLRLWVSAAWALFGAILFLSNAATVHIAQELMTGHYAAGLLFAILSLYGYVRSLREQSWRPALIGASFYLLALMCKEIYFPVFVFLLFLPEGQMRSRLRFFLPYCLVALVYIPWRSIVLKGNLGGYNPEFITNISFSEIWQIIKTFFHLPQILLGGGAVAYAILLAVSLAYFYKNRSKVPVFIVGFVLVLSPLAPLWRNLSYIERFHFFFWWSFSIYFAILLSTWKTPKPIRCLLAILILALSLETSHREMYLADGSKAVRDCHDAASKFILNSNSQQVLYDTVNVWYPLSNVVSRLVKAEKILYPFSPHRAFITSDPESLDSFMLNNLTVWGYNDQCRCIENITARLPSVILDYRKNQFEKPLLLNIKYEQNTVFWEVGPYNDGIYEIIEITTDNSASSYVQPLPSIKGAVAFDIYKKINFYLRYRSPHGWITRSPIFHYEPVSDPVLTWSRK